ncbi:MAG: hypothetical protein LUE24_08060 [Lachnospiraceae bacterium]|nr:hypothetical protein [Lachnospiraceae bacterium]
MSSTLVLRMEHGGSGDSWVARWSEAESSWLGLQVRSCKFTCEGRLFHIIIRRQPSMSSTSVLRMEHGAK